MSLEFSISKAASLTGLPRATVSEVVSPLADPSVEEVVAAFVAHMRKQSASDSQQPAPDGLYSQLALAEMTGTYPLAVKKALKGITPAVNKRHLKQYRLDQKNAAGKTVKQLIESIRDVKTSDSKTRAELADAELKEIKVQKARRELVPYAEVVDGIQRVIHLLYQRTAVNRELCKPCRGLVGKVFNDVRNNSKNVLRSN
jgi:predicted component of type VI protein secretion system